jgi:hypothetical protein
VKEGNPVRKFSERIQKYFMATAFTDVGEFDMAVEILEEKKTGSKETPSKRPEDAEGPFSQGLICRNNATESGDRHD